MSCIDVMYQTAYQPYQHYPFYQRHFTQKFGHYKMQEPFEHDPSFTPHTQSVPPATTSTSPGHSYRSPRVHHHHHHLNTSPSTEENSANHGHLSVKKEDTLAVNDAEPTVEAEYINSRCVLFTYYTGELNKVVDEHFSRALSQPSSFPQDGRVGVSSEENGQAKPDEERTWNGKDGESVVPPMCQRNLPASFWNSNYYSHSKYHHHHHHHTSPTQGPSSSSTHAAHHEALFSDPYPPSLHPHRTVHQPDPWHYPFGSHQNSYPHRSGLHHHELGYGMPSGSSAFNPRYSSLLIQPSVRPGRLPAMAGQCELGKSSDAWGTSYSHGHSQQLSSEIATYGMESSSTALEATDTSKDLYWF